MEGTKTYPNRPSHMINMAAIPIYGKNLLALELGMYHWILEYFQDCTNLWLTLIFLMAWSVLEKCRNIRFHGKFLKLWPENW